MKTPLGDLHRQWAVLDHTTTQTHPDGSSLEVHRWSDFPTILNDRVNQEIERMTESLATSQLEQLAQYGALEQLEIKYNWISYNYSTASQQPEPYLVECVVDLRKMVQTNTDSGRVRELKFYYKP